jgi:hypothetical protein
MHVWKCHAKIPCYVQLTICPQNNKLRPKILIYIQTRDFSFSLEIRYGHPSGRCQGILDETWALHLVTASFILCCLPLRLSVKCHLHWAVRIFVFFFFYSTGVWTQGLHLEPLHQPFCVCVWWVFFKIGSLETVCPGWLWTLILLISASWVARITDVSHRCLACTYIFLEAKYLFFVVLLIFLRQDFPI